MHSSLVLKSVHVQRSRKHKEKLLSCDPSEKVCLQIKQTLKSNTAGPGGVKLSVSVVSFMSRVDREHLLSRALPRLVTVGSQMF